MRFEGKVAVVTGGNSGMGREIGLALAREGAAVVLGGRNQRRGRQVLEEIRLLEGQGIFLAGDVSRPETSRKLVRKAVTTFGGLDLVVANAGMLGLGRLTEIPLRVWDRTLATNLTAIFYLLRAAIPALQKRGGGAVVVNGSIAAFKGFPAHPAYCASKGGLLSLVRQVAVDYGPKIRINLLCPGPVDTPLLWQSAQAFPRPDRAVKEAAEATLLGRLGRPREVAAAALFLLSPEASWITGSALTIDGGLLCR